MSIDDRNRRVKVCKMKREDELLKELTDMIKETKKGQLKWKLTCKTTEYNDEAVKPTVTGMVSHGLLMSATCHMSVLIKAVIL